VFQVFTAVIMKNSGFWNATPYNLVKVHVRVERTNSAYRLRLTGYVHGLFLYLEYGGHNFLRNIGKLTEQTERYYLLEDSNLHVWFSTSGNRNVSHLITGRVEYDTYRRLDGRHSLKY
jgi:hypothetical protein